MINNSSSGNRNIIAINYSQLFKVALSRTRVIVAYHRNTDSAKVGLLLGGCGRARGVWLQKFSGFPADIVVVGVLAAR